MAYLHTKWFGTFLCNKNGIQKKVLFPKDENEIAKKLIKIEKKEILPEEKKLTKGLDVIVSEKRLEKIGLYNPDDSFLKNFEIKPEDFDFHQDIFHKASLILAKKTMEKALIAKDLQIIHMVNALDDLIQTSNLLSERLDVWSDLPKSKEKNKPLQNAFSTVNVEIKNLEDQIIADMEKIAPNVTKIAGPLIGARLISLSGGLEKLALAPASTIQLLGAEKALFRFKKEGGKPPKHGVIFQNQLINKAFRGHRGKIARTLATKISLASKADAFTKRDISAELMEKLKKRVEEIRNQ